MTDFRHVRPPVLATDPLVLAPARVTMNVATDVPLALLPVRLETRYPPERNGATLRVRIYPDVLHVSAHEDGLTDAEVEWGRSFWRESWDAGADVDARALAWTRLAQRFGAPRAAYVAATSAPIDRAAPPVFAEPPRKADTWTRAVTAALLPERWLVRGYRGKTMVFEAATGPVRTPLAVGPAPNAPAAADGEPLDEGMRWMTDFDEARRAGMAVEIELPPAARGRLDVVLAFGVRTGLDPAAGAAALTALLDAHHHDGGLGLIAQGTPTNATDDGADRERDVGYADSFRTELGPPATGGDGAALASALGVPAAVFAHVAGAAGTEQLDAAHMNTALWPATWGYFLEQMMGTLSRPAIDAAREHFIGYVRARGPLPALRVGKQPLGVVPVTSLEAWQPFAGDTFSGGALPTLRRLREVWLDSVRAVPAVDGGPDGPTQLAGALAMDANGRSYRARQLLFEEHVHHLGGLFGWNLDEAFWHQHELQAAAAAAALGLPWIPRLAHGLFSPAAAPLVDRLVRASGDAGADDAPLAPNYLAWLRTASVDDLQRETIAPRPDTLLYLLLRHALLLAHADAAVRGNASTSVVAVARTEPALVDVVEGERALTGLRALAEPAPGLRTSMAAHLSSLAVFELPWQRELGQLKRSLGWLQNRPAGVLAQLLRETLDLSAYRLDAWITSLATRKLASLRARRPAGVAIGGYGWVLGLEPRASAQVAVPAGEHAPIYRAARAPGGWVHAPSVGHATTAAVLRSTRLAHLADGDDRFAIDLSPRRARLVEWLLDGVRHGQPLAALLGYRFERGLHEGHPGLQLDRFVQRFRDQFPLVAGKLEPVTGPTEAIAARNVVDGLALERRWSAGTLDLAGLGVPASGRERDAVIAELTALADAADAVGDALLAESVHQVVRGNPVAAAGTLDALGRGDGPPPELDVLRTPRTGLPLTHRVLILLQDGAAPAGWPDTPRRRAEPLLDRWAAALIGPPTAITATVELGGARIEVGLHELGLAAIDLVTSAGADVEARAIAVARRRAGAGTGPATVALDRGDPTRIGFGDVIELARALRAVAIGGRPLTAAHLALPDAPAGPAPDDAALTARAAAALTALQALAADPTAEAAAGFGIAAAEPAALTREIAARVAAATAATDPRDRLAAIFGGALIVVPPFTAPAPAELATALAASDALTGGDPLAITTWLGQLARVRAEVAPLGDALLYADALGRDAGAALRVAQLPFAPGDRWTAQVPVEGKLALVIHAPGGFDPARPCAGLFLDEWTELVPSATETTGLAFQFDQPGNRAPQAVLLAVAPDARAAWDVAGLERVLLETIDLARLRMVDNRTLTALGHYAPALYFPYNAEGDATSFDVKRLIARKRGGF